jgi:cytochrome c oxidase assembly factor CtaG
VHPSLEAVGLVPALAVGIAALKPSRDRALAAATALALIFAAFITELQQLATHTFLWAHLLQNVVLAEWAPALLVLAIPHDRLRAIRIPMLPALAVWLGTYYVWHLPVIYDAALRRPHTLLHVEHLTYLAAGVAVWWPVIRGSRPSGVKALYLFAAFVLGSPLGLLLALIPRAIYPFYVHAARTWGPRPLADQQIAGVTMALEQAAVFFAVFAFYFMRFFREEQREPELLRRSGGGAGRPAHHELERQQLRP